MHGTMVFTGVSFFLFIFIKENIFTREYIGDPIVFKSFDKYVFFMGFR
jgi:hypothetical protein